MGDEVREFNADLHFHGLYSGGVSKNMLLPVIAEQAKLKGLDICSTADITHAKWLEHVKQELVEESNGVFKHKQFDTFFIVGTEVECMNRIHHLIFFPDIAAAEKFREQLKPHALLDCFGCGRPRVRLTAEQVAQKAVDCGAIIGPAHAFTPYFSVYAHFDSVQTAYGSMGKEINFIELGLSADSYFADLIKENHNYQFLTASDSHPPWPYRIGREFIRLKMKEPSFKELRKALEEKEEARITLNVGLDPREGKYHMTACSKCFAQYALDDAVKLKWNCPECKGAIKRGVRDRILMLADFKEETHPKFRPPYMHSVPLAEIIQIALDVEGINTTTVQSMWRDFVERFGNEINALVDAPIAELSEVNPRVAQKISAFRNGWVHYIAGGGGNYGKPVICNSKEEFEKKGAELLQEQKEKKNFAGQKTLGEF